MTTATYDLTRPEFAVTERERYDDAAGRYAKAQRDMLTWKPIIQQGRETLKEREAELLVNGGNDEWQLRGSNAEQRAASLEVCKAIDKRYQEALGHLRVAEGKAASAEADMDNASQEMRGSRLILEYATAYLARLAAAEGRDGFTERNHR